MTTLSGSSQDHLPVHVGLKPRSDGAERAYYVHIGRGILSNLRHWVDEKKLLPPYIIIADKALLNSQLFNQVRNSLMIPGRENATYAVPTRLAQGEGGKSWEFAGKLLEDLDGINRHSTIIALGGGVIGDLAGFVAAVCMRGINFIQIPTTLVAMVDSSVGGKTGVNLSWGKNLAGVFHQPRLVVADLNALTTLPKSEFNAGMAEVIKYGAIKDKVLFDEVAEGLEPTSPRLEMIVRRCVEIKASIVEQDEFETGTQRALLNFGHTIGHAIERETTLAKDRAIKKALALVSKEEKDTATRKAQLLEFASLEEKYAAIENAQALEIVSSEEKKAAIEKARSLPTYLHGEAIGLGMRAAAWLSLLELKLPLEEFHQIILALNKYELPTHLPSKAIIHPHSIYSALFNDKKVAADGKNRWVLLNRLGEASSGHPVSNDRVREAIALLYEPV